MFGNIPPVFWSWTAYFNANLVLLVDVTHLQKSIENLTIINHTKMQLSTHEKDYARPIKRPRSTLICYKKTLSRPLKKLLLDFNK